MAIIGTTSILPSQQKKELEELTEIPNKIRFLVEAAPNMNSKIATLQKFYDNVEPLEGNNFIVTDNNGNKFQLDNKNVTNLSDAIDLGKEATEMVGSMIGTTAGGAAGSVVPVYGTAIGAIAGSGAGMAAGAELFERVGQKFGAEILRTNKEWAAQRATDFAFGSIGQAVAPLILKPLKGAFTGYGKTGIKTAERLKNYIDAGVTPSLGQVTQKRGFQTMEMVLGNIPGGSGRITKIALKAQDELGKKSLSIAEDLIGKAIPDEVVVGKTIVGSLNGINNPKSFVGMFQSRAGVLFGKIDDFIKPETLINLSRPLNKQGFGGTIETIKKFASKIPGAENTTKSFGTPFLTDLLENLSKDVAKSNGSLPYAAVKSIKQKIGNKLSSFDIIPDVDKGQLKLIYGALSEDLKIAAKKYGGVAAEKTITRANKFYEAGLKRIDDYLKPIIKAADPDKIASTIINSGKEGVTRIRAIKKSILATEGGEGAYKVFLSNLLERMGRLQPSQTIGGDIVEASGKFSSETFLTNWNKLSSSARKELFKGSGWSKELSKSFDDVTKISGYIRQSGKTFKNPSGTADRVVGQFAFLGGGGLALMGSPQMLLSVLAVIPSANVIARMFTNPSFIKWLSQGIKIADNKGMDATLQHIGKLGTIMANADSETRQFIYEYLQMIQGKKEE